MPFVLSIRKTMLLSLLSLLCLLSSCHQQATHQGTALDADPLDSAARALILSGVTQQNQNMRIAEMLTQYKQLPNYEDLPYYWFLRASALAYNFQNDSILSHFQSFRFSPAHQDEIALQKFFILKAKTKRIGENNSELFKEMIKVRNEVEESKSIFIYTIDDIMAMSYFRVSDYENARKHIDLYFNEHPYKNHIRLRQRYYDIRVMISLNQRGNPEISALLDSCKALAVQLKDTLAIMRSMEFEAHWLKAQGKTAEAVAKNRVFFKYLKKINPNSNSNINFSLNQFHDFARVFVADKQPDSAIYYMQEGIKWAEKHKIDTSAMFEIHKILSEAYALKGDYRKAYEQKEMEMKDYSLTIANRQKTAIAELSTKYETDKKDRAISSLKANNDLNRQLMRQQRWIFAIVLLLLTVIIVFIYKSYKDKFLRSEHDKLRLQNKQLLLEQKNRQNQLNPHFVYNAISNLQGLISANRKQEANQYLVTLTKVIRDMLELNRQDFITLDKEIKSLRYYVELQQMRFSHSFQFKIETGSLELENILIPPMLVQPFVENAIEHGLKNLEKEGLLQVEVTAENNTLLISIMDNGQGGQDAWVKNPNKESLSQIITEERIELLFGKDKNVSGVKISPNFKADGTGYKVEIYIPLTLYFD